MTATLDSATALLPGLTPHPVIATLGAPEAGRFAATSQVLSEAGFRCLEFTLTTEIALDAPDEVRGSHPDDLAALDRRARAVIQSLADR